MALKIHKAVTDAGGAIGPEISSGDPTAFLPDISKVDFTVGATTFRKVYLKNDLATNETVQFGISEVGVFDMLAIYPSTGDAQVVGDLTGSETKYGASPITKAIDTVASEETVNGAGGLINIKKVVVPKVSTYVLFRVGDLVVINGDYALISAIVDLGTEFQITLGTEIGYSQVIGKVISSQITETISGSGHASYWVEQHIEAGSSTPKNYNSTQLMLDY